MSLGIRILRMIVGLLFVGHGTQKLFGWFGGGGPEGTGQFFESLDLRPGERHATAAGAAEAGGGALLAVGLATPVAAAALSATMITAIRKVHAPNGPWVTDGGYEYPLALLGVLVALTDEDHGPGWALAQLAAGAAGSYLATEVASEPAPAAPAAPATTAP